MFREIRRAERITDKVVVKEDKEFLKIKPESDITVKDCNAFWDSIFGGEEL